MKHSTEDTVDKFTEAIKNFPIDDLTRNSVIWIHKQAITSERTRCREDVIEECAVAVWTAWASHDDAMQDTETSRTFSKAVKTIRSLKTNTEVK